MTLLSICIATVDARIHHLQLPVAGFPATVEWLVIHQVTDAADYAVFYEAHPGVTFYTMHGKGLSRSRNKALNLATGKWIYLCDDDIVIDKNLLHTIEAAQAQWPEAGILTLRLQTPENGWFKQYKTQPFLHTLPSIGSISSGEILLHKSAVESGAILFDERFGLGASFISGEEYLMLRQAMRQGIKIAFFPANIGVHPANSTGTHFTPQLIASKGALIANVYGHACWLLNSVYAIRKYRIYRHQLGFFMFLKYIYSGSKSYFNGG